MLDPSLFSSAWDWTLPLLVFGTSVVGSIHCAGMCGPLVLSLVHSRKGRLSYHLGRGVSYTLLGVVGGAFGGAILEAARSPIATAVAILIAIAFLLGAALSLYRKARDTWTRLAHRSPPLVLGLLSPLLPCAWLYGYLLAGAATLSPLKGGLVLLSFWLGTLPFLLAAPTALQWLTRKLPPRAKTAMILFFIFIAALNLFKVSRTPPPSHTEAAQLTCTP